jgi:hypothetical protein
LLRNQEKYEKEFGLTLFSSASLKSSETEKAMLAIKVWYPNKRDNNNEVIQDRFKEDGTVDKINREEPTKEEFMETLWNNDRFTAQDKELFW